jgi:uncharacterized protein (TIGR02001 family)
VKKGFLMRKTIFKLAAACAVLGSMSAMPAYAAEEEEGAAEEEAEGPITISGGVTVVSDYRFRGVSLTDKDPAIQPTITIKHESGFYAGLWGSNLANNPGDDLEVDIFAGFGGGDAVTYDLGVTYYVYPGVSSFNYFEATAKLGTTLGPLTVGGQLSYVPSQDNTGNTDNVYAALTGSFGIPDSPVTINGSMGIEDGAFTGGSDKLDWSLGATASFSGFTAGVAYVDTDRQSVFAFKDAKAGVVFSLGYSF